MLSNTKSLVANCKNDQYCDTLGHIKEREVNKIDFK